ncbi:hypothetical protein [Methanogenium cariaci]|uniref:hypothetical protein n=1 Tax=Methanogenium cariaci TaxID=2197 RepID=UPI0007818261|nr:hypothetical protein [Methanogenium cariaci]
MVNRIGIIVLVGLCLCLLSAGCTTSDEPAGMPEDAKMTALLENATAEVSVGLSQLQECNAESAEKLSKTGITGDAANTLLQEKLVGGTSPYLISSLVIDPEGIVTAAAPAHYETIVGTDLGYQPEVQYAHAVKKPVLSGIFMLEEGFPGISMSYPVFSGDIYLGYTDLTFGRKFFAPVFPSPPHGRNRV